MNSSFSYQLGKNKKLFFWFIQLIAWTFYFFLETQVLHRYTYLRFNGSIWLNYLYPFIYCYLGLPLTLLLKVFFEKLFSLNKNMLQIIIYGIGAIILLGNIWYAFSLVLDHYLGKFGYTNYLLDYLGDVFLACLILLSWSSIYLSVELYQKWLYQKLKAEKALILAENAQLKMLRYQLNPHFLFNSLSSLRALIRVDSDKAVTLVSKISEFLRYSLVNKTDILLPLEQEIKVVKDYIDIEKIRFGDKLKVDFKIDTNTFKFQIPSFILHPIIENAIKYGMASSSVPLKITVQSKLNKAKLIISISNSGKWIPKGSDKGGTGTGLENIKERLAFLFPNEHSFEIDKTNEIVKVIIQIDTPQDAIKI